MNDNMFVSCLKIDITVRKDQKEKLQMIINSCFITSPTSRIVTFPRVHNSTRIFVSFTFYNVAIICNNK